MVGAQAVGPTRLSKSVTSAGASCQQDGRHGLQK